MDSDDDTYMAAHDLSIYGRVLTFEERLQEYYRSKVKSLEWHHGLESADRLLVKMTLEQALQAYLPEFKVREKVSLGVFFELTHDAYLQEYGLGYKDAGDSRYSLAGFVGERPAER